MIDSKRFEGRAPDFEHVPLGAEVTAYITAPYPRQP